MLHVAQVTLALAESYRGVESKSLLGYALLSAYDSTVPTLIVRLLLKSDALMPGIDQRAGHVPFDCAYHQLRRCRWSG